MLSTYTGTATARLLTPQQHHTRRTSHPRPPTPHHAHLRCCTPNSSTRRRHWVPLPDPGPPSTNTTLWRCAVAAPPPPPGATAGALAADCRAVQRGDRDRVGTAAVGWMQGVAEPWWASTRASHNRQSVGGWHHPTEEPHRTWTSAVVTVAVHPALGISLTVMMPAAAKPSDTLAHGNCVEGGEGGGGGLVQQRVAAAAVVHSA